VSAAFLAGVVAGYGIAVPVGAIGVLIVGLSARNSLRVGAAAGLGAATADGLYALVAVIGGAAIAEVIVPVATPLRRAAAVVLLALAAWTAISALRSRRREPADGGVRPTSALRAYLGILGLTLLNPATVVYFAALVLGRGDADGGVWFVVGAFLASASWQLLIAGGGSVIGRLLTGERGRLITALVSSSVIALLAVLLL
jgi:arginine exporter protein ArgO